MSCPCHSGEEYASCCEPYHLDEELPPTPEKLMRSRYSAYALGLVDYIQKTQKKKSSAKEIRLFCESTEFRNLEILEAKGECVTFRATLFQTDRDVSFTEKSRFKKVNGRWIYVEALSLF